MENIRVAFVPVLEGGRAERAIILGSYARDEADEYSGVDLVIIKKTDLPFLDRYTDFNSLFRVTPKALQVLVYTPEEFDSMRDTGNPFINDVIKDGVAIYVKWTPSSGQR